MLHLPLYPFGLVYIECRPFRMFGEHIHSIEVRHILQTPPLCVAYVSSLHWESASLVMMLGLLSYSFGRVYIECRPFRIFGEAVTHIL